MKPRGLTLVELLVTGVVVGILASAFTMSVVPMINTFFYFPQSTRVNAAASELLNIIIEGDPQADGLRFAGPPCIPDPWVTSTAYVVGDYVTQGGLNYFCLINHTSGTFATDLAAARWTSTSAWATATSYSVGNYVSYGGYNYTCIQAHTSGTFAADLAARYWSVNQITAASGTSITYSYAKSDTCGPGGKNNNSVTITYDTTNRIVTRNINGGGDTPIPAHVTASSDIKFDRFESNADGSIFFRYYNSAGTEMTSATPIVPALIYRVDVAVEATSGTGSVKDNMGNIQAKTGVAIKRYSS